MNMKNVSVKKAIAICIALVLVLCFTLSGCAGRRSVTAEAFTAACESAGFTLEDATANFDPSAVSTVLISSTATCSIGYYNFTDAAAAKTQYAQLYSTLSIGAEGEKHIDSAEYNRFSASNESGVALLYRNGTTLIYCAGDDVEALSALIDELGI